MMFFCHSRARNKKKRGKTLGQEVSRLLGNLDALKGPYNRAQGNALGMDRQQDESPVRAKQQTHTNVCPHKGWGRYVAPLQGSAFCGTSCFPGRCPGLYSCRAFSAAVPVS